MAREKDRILITVKTYPNLSAKYEVNRPGFSGDSFV